MGAQISGAYPTIGDIVGAFKSLTTNEYIDGVRNNGWPPFEKRFWQRNYYEHIIRDEGSYRKIVEYIETNPALAHDGDDQIPVGAPFMGAPLIGAPISGAQITNTESPGRVPTRGTPTNQNK